MIRFSFTSKGIYQLALNVATANNMAHMIKYCSSEKVNPDGFYFDVKVDEYNDVQKLLHGLPYTTEESPMKYNPWDFIVHTFQQ